MRIALLLGGPSMRGIDSVDLSWRYDDMIGVNWSFLLPNVHTNVVVDYRCMEKMLDDDRFKSWLCRGGLCYFVDHCRQNRNYPSVVNLSSSYPRWPLYGDDPSACGLYCRSHAGLSALSLACLYAPAETLEIDIFGLDLNQTKSGKTENWHVEHDPKWAGTAEASYASMLHETGKAHKLIDPRIRIRNMNPHSAYRGFEFGRHADAR
jgi:hypothetical protein